MSVVTSSLLPDDPPRRHEEDELQRSIVDYARWALPQNALLFAVPNGGKRHKREAQRLVGLGVRAGIPDLILWHDSHTLGIEVKLRNTYLSPHQRQMHDRMKVCGVPAVVVRSLDEFIATVQSFGVRLRARTTA